MLPATDPDVLAAVVKVVHDEGKAGVAMTMGVLVMAHGTPTIARGHRAVLHENSPRSSPRLPNCWPTWSFRYYAIGGVSPLTERTRDQVAASHSRLDERHPGEFDVRFGSKFEPPLLEEAADQFRDEGFDDG